MIANLAGTRNFRADRRRSIEPDATEGREIAHAQAEARARFDMRKIRKVRLVVPGAPAD